MFIKVLRRVAGLGAAIFVLAITAAAQTGQVEGNVKLKGDDNSMKPVPGALVEIYRLDIKGKYDSKTDKTGHYVRLGLPLQGTYLFVVSGQGLQPTWVNGVKVSQQPVVDIVCSPGDGSTMTLEQIQAANAQQKAGGGGGGGGAGRAPQPSAADKAKAEQADKEYQAKVKESKELQATFDVARQHYNTGVELSKASPPNYQGALSEFEQATQVDASKHSAMLMLAYKANANLAESHYQIGVDLFNKKQRDEAKGHFEKAVEAARRAVDNASKDTVENNPNLNNDKLMFYNILSKNVGLLVEHFGESNLVDDTIKSVDAAEALDPQNKTKWEITKGNLYRSAGRTDEAVAAYKGVLATDAKNLDALYNMGLALLGSPEKEKIQESVNALAAFVDAAPPSDKRVADAKSTIEAIRTQFKVEVEKPAKGGRKKP
ncbi:MAG TPA: carboxypeptidase regulatory-like domain-containing protein [Blastocatellia bacterium]|nr:carboxypeptidase regulatory-like domain-containing protein [Blastocatellia bacterium]